MTTPHPDYEQDFNAWLTRNAALLREGRLAEIDTANIAEEMEAMGRKERYELINRLAVLLAHLLKWRLQPQRRGKSWQAAIAEQRLRVHRRLRLSPSLKHDLDASLKDAYRQAVLKVLQETPLESADLPSDCPFTLEQALDEAFLPD